MPVPYYGGWQYLGQHLGEGLAKGATERIGEEREYERTERGFKRLAPHRREKFQEELGQEGERERAAKVLGEEFDIRKAERTQAVDLQERDRFHGLFAPIIESMMPPTMTRELTQEVSPTVPAEILREHPVERVTETAVPFKLPKDISLAALKEVLGFAKERMKVAGKEPRQRTMTEWRSIAETAGHPEQAHATSILGTVQKEKEDLYKLQLEEAGKRPPVSTASERLQMAGSAGVQAMGKEIRQEFLPIEEGGKGGHVFVNPLWGGEGTAKARRFGSVIPGLGGVKPGAGEERMRNKVNRLANYIIRIEAGLTQSQKEEIRQFRVIPSMGTTPEFFITSVDESIRYAAMIEAKIRGELAQPRVAQPARPTPRVGWTLQEDEE